MSAQDTAVSKPSSSIRPDEPAWVALPDEQLLDLRLCDLHVQIAGSVLEDRIAQLYKELDERQITFRPHFWLSDEWFTPDGVPGIAIPFYLAHPRLAKLELNQMLEVEGGDPEWCMRILRHETGHALENAFGLRRRRKRQELFGKSSEPYPEHYTFRPYSKSFVVHLEAWYAQSHPDEDFAETFAVWLTPQSLWEQRYADWPAIKKLQYVDELMKSLAGRAPTNLSHEEVDPLRRLRRTLRHHYKKKRRHYGVERPNVYDRDLRRLFSDAPEFAGNPTAAQFLTKIRRPVRRLVSSWTGIYQYTIDQVFNDIILRCQMLNLRLAVPEETAKLEFSVLLTVQTMNHLYSGGHRVAL
ncbi:MAG TPA: putative zinc-binding metallopeptidase [Nitrospirales bacterium]|nr:putative zinc-binding metallopeptidase [Nitrospirales bacterium]